MKKKRTSGIVAILVVMVMLIGCLPASALHGPGLKEFKLSGDYVIAQDNALINNESIEFSEAGSVTFDYYLPFDSDKLNISYAASQDTVLSITTDNGNYQTVLLADAKETYIPVQELVGSTTLVLSSSNAIVINSLSFEKIDELFNADETLLVELTPYEEAILTSVIIKSDSSAMKVKGATRFLDIENRNLTPKNYNGSLYVPVKSFAEALSLYLEDYPDKSYLYFAGKDEELILVGGTGHFYKETSSEPVTMNVLYDNGNTWVPFRALAELFGYYVTYRDGIAVADDRLCALNIIEKETVFSELTKEMNEYIPTYAEGKTYHVAQSQRASDANSGTESYPFLTLEKAASVAKAGDTVVIHEGTYRETLAPEHDGTTFAPIRFVAADGENVTISALEEVGEFVPYKDNIYCASVPVDFGIGKNQIFYKGKALTEGRHPNADTKTGILPLPDDIPNELWPTRGDISVKVKESNIATSENDLNQTEEDYWKGGTFVTLKGAAWTLVSGEIIGSSYGQIELKDHDDNSSYGLGLGNKTYYKDAFDEDYGYITNHLNTVDMPGEWCCADNMLFFYPPEGADLQNDAIEIKARTLTVDLKNRKNIILENINTLGGSMTMSEDAEGNLINGGHHQYITHFTRILDAQSGHEGGTKYQEPGAPQRGEMGIYLGGENNSVINTSIDFSAGAGIYTTGLYSYIHNNTLRNAGYGGIYPGGITVELERWKGDTIKRGGHTITHNTVSNTGRAGISVCYCPNKQKHPYPMLACEIAYNRVYNGSITARDTGVYYQYGITSGFDRSRTLMHHNMIYNIIHMDEHGKQNAFNIYFDGMTKQVTAYNNLTFYEDEERRPANGFLVQTASTAASNTRTSGHLYLGHYDRGVENLKTQNFPNGKPYYAGSYNDGRDRFMLNYNDHAVNDNLSHYPSSVEDDTYLFENVKIKGGVTNRITMYYRTEPGYRPSFTAEVSLSGEQEYKTKLPMKITSNTQYNTFYNRTTAMAVVFLSDLPEGEYDVTVKLSAPEASIIRLRADESDDNYIDLSKRSVFLAGSYDEVILNPSYEEMTVSVNPGLDRVLNLSNWGVSRLWEHDLVYKDRDVKTLVNALRINYGTHGEWSGSKLILRVDDPKSEPVCEVVLEGSNWVKQDTYAKLNREIQPGKHTFYLDFEGTDKTGDFANFELFYDSGNFEEGGTE